MSTSHNWSNLVERLHNDIMSEMMLMMKKLLLSDKLTPIQRKSLTDICSFIGSVYNMAYTHDHFDIMLYQDKVLKITATDAPWSTTDFDKLLEPNSRDYKLALQLPQQLI